MFKGKNSSVNEYGIVNIKLLLSLTEEQKLLINKYFGHSRFVYNKCLDDNKELYEKEKRSLSYVELQNLLPIWKKDEKTSFLSEVDATSLQQAVQDYCTAREKFLKKQGGYPKHRSKYKKETFRIINVKSNNSYSIRFDGSNLKLGKFGWVITKPCQTIPDGEIQSATIKRTKTGKVFATLTIRKSKPTVQFAKTNKETGIDVGMKNFAVFSNGVSIETPSFLHRDMKKIAKLQQELARKEQGSKNYEKCRIKLAKMFERVYNRKNDFLHKLSLSIVKEYDLIAMESLDITSMLKDNKESKKHIKNQRVSELGWYTFMQMIKYKAEWYGKEFIQIDKYYPSSQTCSHCGHINPEVKDEKVRHWICPNCSAEHDRDHNAAINILNEGKRMLGKT